jgi:hypothetical protein
MLLQCFVCVASADAAAWGKGELRKEGEGAASAGRGCDWIMGEKKV